jgi:kynureninase
VVSSALTYENSEAFALQQDESDELAKYRDQFFIPTLESLKSGHWADGGQQCVYLAGNSLGLQPREVGHNIQRELADWAAYGVEGHFSGDLPWLPYHEFLTASSARLVGAQPLEVVVMNTLTVNLHLMMVSFYNPTKSRYKIVVEGGAFPSDQYAVASQARFHGFDPKDAVVELRPRADEETLRTEDIVEVIEKHGDSVALVMLGNVNYLTGQAFQIDPLVKAAHKVGALFGLNLAHGAGNLYLELHDWNVDFAVWCSYKYLNSGPGSLAGCFVHERHARNSELPRFAGWWGHNKETRFKMGPDFEALPGAEGWQLSNPPIFQLAALRASLTLFDEVGMRALRNKGDRLTGFLEFLLKDIPGDFVRIITPSDPTQRGSQLSIVFNAEPKKMLEAFKEEGVICDFREPNIIRATPVPFYSTFLDVYRFASIIRKFAQK